MRERPAFVLDALAMIAFLNDEPGEPRVDISIANKFIDAGGCS
ncbi:MAG: hypothetical protein ACK4Z6_01770 [Candidatus Methylomirabilales bacterium]